MFLTWINFSELQKNQPNFVSTFLGLAVKAGSLFDKSFKRFITGAIVEVTILSFKSCISLYRIRRCQNFP
jgi:hypothetical protein